MAYVYVLSNPGYIKGMYKIGMTSRDELETRISELSSATGVPCRFVPVYSVKCDLPTARWVETAVHHRLDRFRTRHNREFFECPLWYIKAVISFEMPSIRLKIWTALKFASVLGAIYFITTIGD